MTIGSGECPRSAWRVAQLAATKSDGRGRVIVRSTPSAQQSLPAAAERTVVPSLPPPLLTATHFGMLLTIWIAHTLD